MNRIEAFSSLENMCYRAILLEPDMRGYTLEKVLWTTRQAMLTLEATAKRYKVQFFKPSEAS